MYKVFFNQKPLVLTDKILETTDLSPLIFIKYTSASLIIKALKSKKNIAQQIMGDDWRAWLS